MSEKKYFLAANGQEVQKEDLELLGETSGYADDRVLWELLRVQPGSATPQKLIVPYGASGWTGKALVGPSSADGKVRVQPFRAVVGSTTLEATSPIESLRGVRSGYFVGSTTIYSKITINANSAGNPRWTLVYAVLTPDVNGASVTRYKKDPTTLVVSSSSVSTYKAPTVTVTTVDGTAAASPTRPALPADGGGAYNIPLAYVWVPDGFGATSTVNRQAIDEEAPCALVSTAMGTANMMPANQQFKLGGTVQTNQASADVATRPGAYVPSTMVGEESRVIFIERGVTPVSHVDGDIIDDSIDWRYRYFRWQAHANNGTASTARFAHDRAATGTTPAGSAFYTVPGTALAYGQGQSFLDDSAGGISVGSCQGVACFLNNANLSNMNGTEICQIHVDSTTGALKYKRSGTGTPQIIIWLTATGPFRNYGA